jgi:hypothetical protein
VYGTPAVPSGIEKTFFTMWFFKSTTPTAKIALDLHQNDSHTFFHTTGGRARVHCTRNKFHSRADRSNDDLSILDTTAAAAAAVVADNATHAFEFFANLLAHLLKLYARTRTQHERHRR